jgi:hypothetical protein
MMQQQEGASEIIIPWNRIAATITKWRGTRTRLLLIWDAHRDKQHFHQQSTGWSSVETNLFTKSLSKFFTKFLDKFFEISSTIFVSIILPTLHPKKTNGWWWKCHEMRDLWFQSQFMLHDIQMWKKLTTNKTASFARIWINMLWNLRSLLPLANCCPPRTWWWWIQGSQMITMMSTPSCANDSQKLQSRHKKNSCKIPIPSPASSVAQVP